MLLEAKNAVVAGGADAIGGAVASGFAAAGAAVHPVGRTRSTLDRVARCGDRHHVRLRRRMTRPTPVEELIR